MDPNKKPQYYRPGRVEGKVCCVTGAGGALGREIAIVLAEEGGKVAICDLNEESAKETVQIIKSKGGEAIYHVVDVSKEDQIHKWFAAVNKEYSGIDILVNNAAAFVFGKIEEVTSEDWDKVFGINVKGYAFGIKHVVPYMKTRGKGSIVNINSISGFVAQPQFVPYNTSKGAISQLTRCTAMDLGEDNIRVNMVCPGTIDTPATSGHAKKLGLTKEELVKDIVKAHFLKKLGSPRDVAYAVLYLACDESSFVTGTPLFVDGGYTVH